MASIFDRLTGADAATDAAAETDQKNATDAVDLPGLQQAAPDTELRTPMRLREAAQELLKYGLLEESRKPNLYRLVMTHASDVSNILEPLDLALGLDEVRGLAFVTVRQGEAAEQDEWSHPLVRRQRLNLEQSLLVAILRQHFVAYEQEAGTGASEAMVAIDELIPQLQIYLGDLGSDARERTRVINLLDQLKGHGLVSTPNTHDRVNIRPIIAHLANPENLQALLHWLRDQTRDGEDNNADDGVAENPQ